MMTKNSLVELEITDMTNLGFGVGKVQGAVVFVSGAVTGDRLIARIIKPSSSYSIARIERLIKPSERRTEGRCPIGGCHSCAYREIDYSYELEIKRETVISAMRKAGLSDVRVTEIIGSPSSVEYRNKAQYPIAMSPSGDYIIGFFAPKSHRVTEAAACPLAPREFSAMLETLRAFFKKHSISVYSEESGEGLLRHIYLRRGEVSGEVLLTLVINGRALPYSDELVGIITKEYPSVVGILLNENTERTNVILGERYTVLFGRDYIYDTLCGVRLKISAPSFYQVNHDAAELLYKKARELARLEKRDTLLDLYCGAGSIGLSMAADCREVIGIEIIPSAVECATQNARDNGITNASFYVGDAADTERLLERAEMERGSAVTPDVVILDPPRAGAASELVRFISERLSPSRIVYISCNPMTLARDLALFRELGYVIGEVTAVDLFAGTGHVESVVRLERRLDN